MLKNILDTFIYNEAMMVKFITASDNTNNYFAAKF